MPAEVAEGRPNPRIGERFALRAAAAAHQLLASRTVTGKLLPAVQPAARRLRVAFLASVERRLADREVTEAHHRLSRQNRRLTV